MNDVMAMHSRLLEISKAIGNETRFQIIQLLQKNTLFCGDLVAELGVAQSTVSHHLKILRQAGVVHAEEKGSYVCYRLNRQVIKEMGELLVSLSAVQEQ